MWGEADPILERLRAAAAEPAAVAVSGIVLFEIRYAIARSRRKRQDAERLRTLLSGIQVVPFDANDAAVAGELRAALEAARTPMGLSEPIPVQLVIETPQPQQQARPNQQDAGLWGCVVPTERSTTTSPR